MGFLLLVVLRTISLVFIVGAVKVSGHADELVCVVLAAVFWEPGARGREEGEGRQGGARQDHGVPERVRPGLADKAHLYPAQLSGGQKQRIAIIQQILCSEHFLLMDEPFSGLDIIVEGKATELIMKVANMDDLNTVIVVTHDISAAASIADHIWALGIMKDDAGNYLPEQGATIMKTYDLIERGLCWEQWTERAMIKPQLAEFIREVKNDFYSLRPETALKPETTLR